MAEETQIKIKPRFTLGSVIMWISFILPFVFIPQGIRAPVIYSLFYGTAALLVLGFLIYCWEDFRAGRKFSGGVLFYVCLMLLVYSLISPIVAAAAPVLPR